jgi:tetratricopeptide (TPR) repeat protein
MSTRLDTLVQFYKEDPSDPFNLYALAIEYQKTDTAKSLEYFNILLSDHELYVPTYYHAAKLYQESGNAEKAIIIYEKGIAVAKSQNDLKTARELKSALDELTFDM